MYIYHYIGVAAALAGSGRRRSAVIAVIAAIAIAVVAVLAILSCLVEGFLQSSTHLVAHQPGENLGAFPVSRCLEGWPETPS